MKARHPDNLYLAHQRPAHGEISGKQRSICPLTSKRNAVERWLLVTPLTPLNMSFAGVARLAKGIALTIKRNKTLKYFIDFNNHPCCSQRISRRKARRFPLLFQRRGGGGLFKNAARHFPHNHLCFSHLRKPPLPLLWKRRGKRRYIYAK